MCDGPDSLQGCPDKPLQEAVKVTDKESLKHGVEQAYEYYRGQSWKPG